ncbi:(Fe-S)-binding protein [Dactylosporangium sp. NBC_01737]|uniref:(Fe-S)-binding protein n=1 Tax=Dactylosporangium sp. NBC_01737 TaxID=2975959 RepID=UPI002E1632EC|nr:(Fe-S)-binding protein [Dactylosporangium sp. NBC_01737]
MSDVAGSQPPAASAGHPTDSRPDGAPAKGTIFDPATLSSCISCGFCLPACPTYALTQDERSSPRGRITLMRALQDGRLEPDDPTLREQSSFCLGCRACEPVCPAGVRYGELLEQWRDHQWRGRWVPPKVWALRIGLRLGPLLALGGWLRRAARTPRNTGGDGPQLMLGCAERVLFPRVSRAVQRLVPGVRIPAKQGCCGALHAHNGASAEGTRLARELGRAMPGTILTTSGGCAAHLVQVLGRERIRELSEFLDDTTGFGPVTVDGRPARVAVQDSCHLRNGLGTWREPRRLVAAVAELVELPSAGTCCGAAGTYSLLRPKDSAAVLDPKLDEIDAARVDYLVVVNPGCQRQLISGLRRRRSATRVLHLAELLAIARPPARQALSAPTAPPAM